jgi:hydroxymethylpyrimidine pyrophosphatase-like HAD family hydrolase
VASTLQRLLPPHLAVASCVRAPDDRESPRRDHVDAGYEVQLRDTRTGRVQSRSLAVEGAGLGYLGRQALAVARALPELVPHTYGFWDGLLYLDGRPAAPPEAAPPEVEEEGLVEAITEYASARAHRLGVSGDPTPWLAGRQPAWEVAAELLGRPLGPLGPVARTLLLEPLTRRLMVTDTCSVVDGWTDPQLWTRTPDHAGRWVKRGFHQRSFSHYEAACYDAVFDVAGAACALTGSGLDIGLRAAYEDRSGQRIDAERWLLYRLVHAWLRGRTGERQAAWLARASAAAVHDYLAEVYPMGEPSGEGPLCAIDLDGVLETERLGYPSVSPTGALALRALTRHGFRPVLATGRSLDDVRDRCAAFGLVGAVAEYGAVVYRARDGRVMDLLDGDEHALLDEVRVRLSGAGIEVDPSHRYAVRARSGFAPVPAVVLDAEGVTTDPRLRVVTGQGQTDITVSRVDKGTGLGQLAGVLGATGYALAVGDSASDLPMMGLAEVARAPRNASAAMGPAGVRTTSHGYQKGLSEACGDAIGHAVGSCALCRSPEVSRRTRAVLDILALGEGDHSELPWRALRLAADVVRGRSW